MNYSGKSNDSYSQGSPCKTCENGKIYSSVHSGKCDTCEKLEAIGKERKVFSEILTRVARHLEGDIKTEVLMFVDLCRVDENNHPLEYPWQSIHGSKPHGSPRTTKDTD